MADPIKHPEWWRRIRRAIEPETKAETAAVIGASMVPGVGSAIDAADIAAGIQDKDILRAGLGALGLAVPFVSGAQLKAAAKGLGRFVPRSDEVADVAMHYPSRPVEKSIERVRAADPAAVQVSPSFKGIVSLSAPNLMLKRSPYMDVWHGSKHDFPRFDISKIGTGEGTQAFGWGLYFAENPSVARHYRNLAERGKRVADDGTDLREHAMSIVHDKYPGETDDFGWIDSVINNFMRADDDKVMHMYAQDRNVMERRLEQLKGSMWDLGEKLKFAQDLPPAQAYPVQRMHDELLGEQQNLIAALDLQEHLRNSGAARVFRYQRPGGMYRTRIHADKEDFLSLDKPLHLQPEHVQRAFPSRMRDFWQEEYERQAASRKGKRYMSPYEKSGYFSNQLPKDVYHETEEELAKKIDAAAVRNLHKLVSEGVDHFYPLMGSKESMEWLRANRDNPLTRGIGSIIGTTGLVPVPSTISKELKKHGVPGIRFLDRFSRPPIPAMAGILPPKSMMTPGKTENFVVFDDDLLEILDKKKKKGGLIES